MIDNYLLLKAFNNDTDALLQIGYAYYSGEEGEQGKIKASVFFGKAVEAVLKNGDTAGIEKISRFLEEHIGKEPEAAAEETESEQKDVFSDTSGEIRNGFGEEEAEEETPEEEPELSIEDIVNQAKDLFLGRNVEKNYEEAKQLFETAASSGNAEAKKYIAYMCMNGLGGDVDLARAEELLRDVFYGDEKEFREETGMALADLYANRLNNMTEAVRIWEMLAFEGNANAQYNFGLALFRGIGTEANPERGIFWWQSAAKSGHKDAEYNLNILYGNKR